MQKKSLTRLAILLTILVTLVSCGKTTSSTSFKLTNISFLSGATLSSDFDGGALIFGRNTQTGETFQLALDPNSSSDISIDLAFGPYDFKAVGWHSGTVAANLKGTSFCAQTSTLIDSVDTPVDLLLSSTTCNDGTFLDVNLYNASNTFNLQTCHGITKIAGLGERDDCAESPSITRSIKIKYSTINQDGSIDPLRSLTSACINNLNQSYNFDVTGAINLVRAENGFNTPVQLIAYKGTNCSLSSKSIIIPRNNLIPQLDNFLFRKDLNGSQLLVGIDSCSFEGALESIVSPFAETEQPPTPPTTSTFTICNLDQFNKIVSYPNQNYLIARTIDFQGSDPSTAMTAFQGSLIGDFKMFFDGIYHFKGANSRLFDSIGGLNSEVRDLNILASTTSGPLLANTANKNLSLEEISIKGDVLNNTSNTQTLITDTYDNCGGLINSYISDTLSSYEVNIRDIKFNSFTTDCTNSGSGQLSVGGVFGAIVSPSSTNSTNVNIDNIKGDITFNNSLGLLQQSLGGLIGTSSENNFLNFNSIDISFKSLASKAYNIGGFIGEVKNGMDTQYGGGYVNSSSVNMDITSSLPVDAIQGIGGIIGRLYNPGFFYITKAVTNGSIVSNHKNAGGLVGYAGNLEMGNFQISNSFNNMDITAGQHAGGFIGSFDSNQTGSNASVTISGSINNANIKSHGEYEATTLTTTAGGFIGCAGCGTSQVQNLDIQNSSNKGTVEAYKAMSTTDNYASAIVGLFNAGSTTLPTINFSDVYFHNPSYRNYDHTDPSLLFSNTKFISKSTATNPITYNLSNLGCPTCTSPSSSFFTGDGTNDSYMSALSATATIADPAVAPLYSSSNGLLKIENLYDYFFIGGKAHGNESMPFEISTTADAMMLNNLGAEYFSWKVLNNIDMQGERFQVGEDSSTFEGSFDGGYNTISNFVTDFTGTLSDTTGIFPIINYGRIHNITFANGVVKMATDSGLGSCGLLAGKYQADSQYWDGSRPQVFNVELIENTLVPGNCANSSAVFGSVVQDQNLDTASNPILRFSNIKVRDNNFSAFTTEAFGTIVGSFAPTAASNLVFNNIEVSRNLFGGTNSGAFLASSASAGNAVWMKNTLFVDQALDPAKSPAFVHLDPAAVGSYATVAGLPNYVFTYDSVTYTPKDLVAAAYTNTTANKLSQAPSTDFTSTYGVFFYGDLYGVGLNFPLLNYQMNK